MKALLYAIKNRKFKEWFYEFQHGHSFMLQEEAEIIIETRLNDIRNKWMNDTQIQKLVKLRVKEMYKKKFPNAKPWSFPSFENFTNIGNF